jgi:hypothetical protein
MSYHKTFLLMSSLTKHIVVTNFQFRPYEQYTGEHVEWWMRISVRLMTNSKTAEAKAV